MYLKKTPFINKVTIAYHTTVLNFIYFSKSAGGGPGPHSPSTCAGPETVSQAWLNFPLCSRNKRPFCRLDGAVGGDRGRAERAFALPPIPPKFFPPSCIEFRLQNSPYFGIFKNARTVKLKDWSEALNGEQDWEETPHISPHTPYEARALCARETLTLR